MKRVSIAASWIIIILLIVSGNACDHVQLSLLTVNPNSALSTKQLCTSPPTLPNTPIKILFLVDQSGSNCTQQGIPPTCDSSGTDPNKAYRLGLMSNFVNSHQADTNISYGLITFAGINATALINNGSPAAASFTSDLTKVAAALTAFQGTPDSSATPYKAALTMANQAITNDVAQASQPAAYFIVLISDGQPTDYSNPPDQNQINADVKTLITTGGKATLSTIYYNQLNVAGDIAVLQSMANVGGGGFSNTNVQGKDVPLEQIIALTDSYPWVITQMMVTNLNSAPCDDGTMDVDSDADGICDKDEVRYNTALAQNPTFSHRMNGLIFDPQNRNSFNSSYNDLFYYLTTIYQCNFPPS